MKLLAPTSILFTTNKGLQRKIAFPQDWLTINQEAGEAGGGLLPEDGFGRDIPPGSFNPNHIIVEISSFSYFVSDKNWDKFWHIYYRNLCVMI